MAKSSEATMAVIVEIIVEILPTSTSVVETLLRLIGSDSSKDVSVAFNSIVRLLMSLEGIDVRCHRHTNSLWKCYVVELQTSRSLRYLAKTNVPGESPSKNHRIERCQRCKSAFFVCK